MNHKSVRFRVAIIGPPRSGKSCFIKNVCHQDQIALSEYYYPTPSIEVTAYQLNFGGLSHNIQLWDCGSDFADLKFQFQAAFFNNVSASVVICNLIDQNWMDKFADWVKIAYQHKCFLIYAVLTHKDALGHKMACAKDTNLLQQYNQYLSQQAVNRVSLRQSLMSQQIEQDPSDLLTFSIDQFFQNYNIKHCFQDCNKKINSEVLKMFLRIHDDQKLVSRSSLARAFHSKSPSIAQFNFNSVTSVLQSLIDQLPDHL